MPRKRGNLNKIRLKSPDDVRKFIAKIINEVKEDTLKEGKAKTIGYLCNSLLKAMETTDLDERLRKLEEAAK